MAARSREWWSYATPEQRRGLEAADFRRTAEAALFKAGVTDDDRELPDFLQEYMDAQRANPLAPKREALASRQRPQPTEPSLDEELAAPRGPDLSAPADPERDRRQAIAEAELAAPRGRAVPSQDEMLAQASERFAAAERTQAVPAAEPESEADRPVVVPPGSELLESEVRRRNVAELTGVSQPSGPPGGIQSAILTTLAGAPEGRLTDPNPLRTAFELLDRSSQAALGAFTGENPVESIRQALQGVMESQPERFSGRDVGFVRSASDEDIIGSLSPRDIFGGIAEAVLSPEEAIPGGVLAGVARRNIGGAIRTGLREGREQAAETAVRQAEGALETSTLGILRREAQQLPPPVAGTVRLYRAEPATGGARGAPADIAAREGRVRSQIGEGGVAVVQAGQDAARGRWFTLRGNDLQFFVDDIESAGQRASIRYVDVPRSDLESFRVSNLAAQQGQDPARFSRNPANEFFLPRDIADTAVAAGDGQVIDLPLRSGTSPGAVQRATDVPFRPQVAGAGIDAPPGGIVQAATDDAAAVAVPSTQAQNILGLRPIEAGLSRRDELSNAFKETIRAGVPASPVATPAMAERARVQPIIRAQAARVGAVSEQAARSVFDRDEFGRVASLANDVFPDGPTIPDIAARLPTFGLSSQQSEVMDLLRREVEPYSALYREVDIEVGTAKDIMDGGFWLPRGRAGLEGVDEPLKVGAGRSFRGTKTGAEKGRVFDSQAEGIAAGFRYPPLGDTLRAFAEDAGVRATDQHVANYFRSVTDESGGLIAQSVADRVNPQLRATVESLRSRIAVARQTLIGQTARSGAQAAEAARAGRVAEQAGGLVGGATERLEGVRARRPDRTIVSTEDDFLIVNPKAPTDEVVAAAVRELRILEREAQKTTGRAGAATERTAGTELRRTTTQARIGSIRDELDSLRAEWERAKTTAQQTPRGQGRIGFAQLSAFTFPDEIANAADAVLRSEGPATGAKAALINTTDALNNLYRGFRATLDNSALGIQGLLGLADDQRAYVAALKVNLRAWGEGGDQVLGSFIRQFDDAATEAGRLNSRGWAQQGLQIGGAQTEFQLGAGSFLGRAPGIRQANRAFGFFGDVLRLEWADHELDKLLRQGRPLQEVLASGDVERIAQALNGTTGWSPTRTFGTIGDLLLFAPRFLQSRLETVARGIGGLRPGAPIDQRLARRSLLKLVGYGTVMTVAVNEMLGNETDFRPLVNGRPNSNFMRIRALDRDWSVFGTWDSLARAIILSAQGKPQDAARTMGSGLLTTTWDFLSGQDFRGDPIPNTRTEIKNDPAAFAQWIAGQMTPFATQELPAAAALVGEGVRDRDPRSLLGAGALVAGEATGAKSSPVTPFERTKGVIEQQTGQSYESLTQPQRLDALEAAGELESSERERVSRLLERSGGGDRTADALLVSVETRRLLSEVAESGVDEAQYRAQRATIMAGHIRTLREYNDVFESFRESSTKAERDASLWFDLFAQAEGPGQIVDFDRFEELEVGLRDTLGASAFEAMMGVVNAVDPRDNPLEQRLQTLRTELGATDFFEIRDRAWTETKSLDAIAQKLAPFDTWADYREAELKRLEARVISELGLTGADAADDAERRFNNASISKRYTRLVGREEDAWARTVQPELVEQARIWDYLGLNAAQRARQRRRQPAESSANLPLTTIEGIRENLAVVP